VPSDDLPSDLVFAGLWRRLAGFGLELVLFLVTLGVGWLGWSAYEWRFGRTPAKRLLGMTVVHPATGAQAGWQAMALREVVYGIGIVGLFGAVTLGLGWAIGAAFVLSPSKQAMWDRLAFTAVVRQPSGEAQ
jgi:uncharacterized RDD family membrane protein YckC